MFRFSATRIASLADELTKPFVEISTERTPHGAITSVTLLRTDGSGLTVTNVMNQIDERGEMGSLVLTPDTKQPAEKATAVAGFGTSFAVRKMVSIDRDTEIEAESGLCFEADDGARLVVAAAVYPYSLHVSGAGPEDGGEKEYSEDNYRFEIVA